MPVATFAEAHIQRYSTESQRRDQVWGLFQKRALKDVRCNGIADCNGLVQTFLKRSGIDFVSPSLRASSPSDSRLRQFLGPCSPKDLDKFTINDSVKSVHADRAFGPVTLYAVDEVGAEASWRIEFEGLRRLDPPKGKLEPYHGIKTMDRVTCALKEETYYNQDGLIDVGFFRYRSGEYRYLIGQPPGMAYYFVLLHPGGIGVTRPETGLYFEMQ